MKDIQNTKFSGVIYQSEWIGMCTREVKHHICAHVQMSMFSRPCRIVSVYGCSFIHLVPKFSCLQIDNVKEDYLTAQYEFMKPRFTKTTLLPQPIHTMCVCGALEQFSQPCLLKHRSLLCITYKTVSFHGLGLTPS